MQETLFQFLGWEGPLEKEKATHSSILAWRIPWTEEPGGQQSMESQRAGHDWAQMHIYLSVFSIYLSVYPSIHLTSSLSICSLMDI